MQADLTKQGLPPAALMRLLNATWTQADYAAYSKTPWFRELTERAKEVYGHRCKMCGRHRDRLTVHHNSTGYRHLFREDVQLDVTLICPTCHRRHHRR